MQYKAVFSLLAILSALFFTGCENPATPPVDKPLVITASAISGVTAPVYNATPATTVTDTAEFSGTISWSDSPTTFAASTSYTATITLKAKTGYTLNGVAANSFIVAGASIVTHEANSGVVTAVFPPTGPVPDQIVTIAAISGVTVPVTGTAPAKTIVETAQYTGTIEWTPSVRDLFVSNTSYSATITLTAKTGYTFSGIAQDFFTIPGATSTNNTAGSRVVKADFPATTANLSVATDYAGTGVGTLKAVQGGTFHNGTSNMTVSSFRISQFEITRAQFAAVMGTDPSDPSYSSGTDNPVQKASWYHAIAFCNKLSIAEGLSPVYAVSGITDWVHLDFASIPTASDTAWNAATADWTANGYRLPTEAEWRFAFRGGKSSKSYTYSGSNTIGDVAVFGYYGSIAGRTTTARSNRVGSKSANELGLHDMSGNVMEWCWDYYVYTLPASDLTDYRGPAATAHRLMMGGTWLSPPNDCQDNSRSGQTPDVTAQYSGFRVVRP